MHQPTTRRGAVAAMAVIGMLAIGAVGMPAAGAATDVTEWGETFCEETTVWLNGAQAGAEDLAANTDVTKQEAKDLVVDFLDTGVGATKAYAKAVKKSGAPDVENGKKIQKTLVKGIKGTQKRLTAAKKRAAKLPVDDASEFQSEYEDLASELRTFLDPWTDALGQIDGLDPDQELLAQLRPIPACDVLANAGGGSSG